MNRLILLSALAASAVQAEGINGELRAFSFDRSFDGVAPHSRAVTVGGVVRYETPKLNDVSATIGYYGSFNTNAYSDQEGKGTALLQANGENIGFIGEANLKYDDGAVQVVLGRQRLSTPLANDHDLRLLPSAYHGVTAMYKPWGLQGGHITKYSGFGSKYDGFKDIPTFDFVSFSKYGVNAQAIRSDLRDYYYADYTVSLGDLTLKAQGGANDNTTGKDSTMWGAKATYQLPLQTSVSLLGNEIHGNRWLAIESGAMFSDWQQGMTTYEPLKAYGVQVSNTFGGLQTIIGAVKVDGAIADVYTEYQADLIYLVSKSSKVRLRYSEKHSDPSSTVGDRNDLRMVYYYGF